ncbi:MAG: hypothetical protein K2X82_18830 [Gemmataceae bacterium]|nr:hypothetical protein [Gemmataceae bacterium]
MSGTLRAGAAVQMILGAGGFLATLGFYGWWFLRTWPDARDFPAVGAFGLALVFALLFNFGGMLWMTVDATYRPRPRPAAPPASPAG